MKTLTKLATTSACVGMLAFSFIACNDAQNDGPPDKQPTDAELKAKDNPTNAFPGLKPGEKPPGPDDNKGGRPPGGAPGSGQPGGPPNP